MFIVGIILCFIPLLFAVLFFKFKSKIKLTHQLIAILLGLVAVLPISFLQFFLPNFADKFSSVILYSLLKSFVLYGLIEEVFKMVLLLPLPHKNYSLKDFILLAFVMGLALGCFESMVYYFDHLQNAVSKGADLLYGQIFLRIFTSDIIHMTCTGLSALFIYSCRSKKKKISPLIWAILIHSIYDFFAGFNSSLRIFSFAVVLFSIIECRVKYKDLQKEE